MRQISVSKEKYSELMNDVKILRSTVVEFAITIEQIISEILIDYIGTQSTKNILEKHLFSDVLDFDKKISLFNALNKNSLLPKVEDGYKVADKLLYIKMLRNYMAHCSIHNSVDFIDNYNRECIEFGSFTQRDEHVIIKVYLGKNIEDLKSKIYSAELYYETCKSVINHLLLIHKQLEE
ncbi:hypothetical protein [Flavobacterium sp. LB2P44]|uniref:hypothetical protein n=1 Tax=Flavobacterium sp. LB2P44 TaxID=3401713 RepID=UPI003AAFA6D6